MSADAHLVVWFVCPIFVYVYYQTCLFIRRCHYNKGVCVCVCVCVLM